MACTSVSISSAAKDIVGLHRSDSGADLLKAKMRRSRSEPHLRCSLAPLRAAATTTTSTRMKSSRSVGMLFPFNFSFKSLLFDSDDGSGEMAVTDGHVEQADDAGEECLDEGIGEEKRANWIDRILELRSSWRARDRREERGDDDEENTDYNCGVDYDSDGGEIEDEEWEPQKFRKFLTEAPWSETKLFSKLAFLCNIAYVIPQIKAEDLKKYYDLRLVTSSLEKKLEAAIKFKLDGDSTRPHLDQPYSDPATGSDPRLMRPIRSAAAYEIAASAASYVHSRAKGLLGGGGGGGDSDGPHVSADRAESRGERVYKSEVAAFVAASTMTAVVAAEETARLEAAKSLQSLHSSPCEWFVCDDPSTCTRCFVIQGSDSLASWQANLLFEPTKFEETEVLVHRGIYEAAKGIYEQFMPEILDHLRCYGERARFRFTGHSLGGSLSLLVNLMLRGRGVLPAYALLPVVTFGSPSVFCGGRRVMDELGLEEGQICSVMMHRDIVPRAFSCNYPNHVAQLLKRLNGTFRSHPCLNSEKVLYSPLGKLYILQPDEKSSPQHPLLPPGAALYSLHTRDDAGAMKSGAHAALKVFLNSPHPLETLSDPAAYGSEGSILRDHDSSNYLKTINALVREQRAVVRRSRKQRPVHWLPSLSRSMSLASTCGALDKPSLVAKEVVSGV